MRFFSRFFGGSEPPPPVLVRVHGPAGPARSVEVRARWAPSGRVLTRELIAESGLCIVPWLTDATAVELQLRVGRARGSIALDRDTTRDGAVIDVDLQDRPSVPA